MRPRDISDLIIRAELVEQTSNFTTRNIIAGFPGVGKSEAAKLYPDKFLDMESSDYHWIYNEEGNKSANPMWPVNYFKAIMEAANKPFTVNGEKYLYILISTHKEVLDLLKRYNVYYMAVVPKTKDIYIQRYIDRKSPATFIETLDKNFEKFIKDIENSSAFGIHYTDDYLANIYIYNPKDENTINYTIDFTNFGNTNVSINEDN